MERKTLASLFIVAIMVLSIFAVVLDSTITSSNKAKYNGYKFTQTPRGWLTKIKGNELLFNFFPAELEHLEIPASIIEKLKTTKALQITYDSENPEATVLADIQFLLEQRLRSNTEIYVLRGMTRADENMPVLQITCANATQQMPVVLLNTANSTKIYEENNCILAEGDAENLLMFAEKTLYVLLGVMQ